MALLSPTRDEALCRPCDADLWREGSHRRHNCRDSGCVCPVCQPHPYRELLGVLEALEDVIAVRSWAA